ncbi:hypothetical protein DVK44_19655 [Streptomyces paludis]|uniref:Uncharacterized protein n=1 Tax=Streptomyces paludis TaxID=2282738 RepID=A0A345HS23_9ACTN|nr:hypothetical protein DVK44_19655 [Streptomyces paludis]
MLAVTLKRAAHDARSLAPPPTPVAEIVARGTRRRQWRLAATAAGAVGAVGVLAGVSALAVTGARAGQPPAAPAHSGTEPARTVPGPTGTTPSAGPTRTPSFGGPSALPYPSESVPSGSPEPPDSSPSPSNSPFPSDSSFPSESLFPTLTITPTAPTSDPTLTVAGTTR